MAIVNRDVDASQQKDIVNMNLGAVATGVTKYLIPVAYPCTLQSARFAAQGVSNAMQVAINNVRFIVGSGATTISMGISNMILQNQSLSGIIGYSGLAAQGSSFLQLQTGDVISVVTSVSNGNATDLAMQLVLKKVQDIVSYNGVVS